MVRLSQWLLRSPKPTRTVPRPRFRAEFLEDRLVPAGAVTTQGDAAILADQVRQLLGLDGSGVTIGVISDSFNLLGGAAADVASGDLPGVGVLSEGGPGGRDEGRAMLQIIHDIAPGATLLFASAGVSQVQLAASIRALANAGADIIVDDVTFPAEPMFQDGVVAQAVDQCAAAGIVYFSAAGNLGRQSYQSAFVNSGVNLGTSAGGAVTTVADFFAHDFDGGPGEDLYQTVTLPAGRTTFSFQWADRYASAGGPGAETDMDLALFDENGVFLSMIGGFSTNVGGDPVEVFEVDAGAGGTYQIALGKVSGPDPALVKYVAFADGFKIDEYDTQSSTVFGHANAAGAIAVGAARYSDTPRFGAAPPAARAFTGRGGTPILFDTAGNPLPSSTRPSPLVVAPDGVNTTFFGSDDEPDGFPNFVGTSASAPHAAAVAALMLQANRGLTPAQVADVLAGTALDIGPAGVDVDTGAGLIQALPAVLAVGSHFDVTLDGTDGDDTYLVRRDSSGQDVEFFRNGRLVLRVPVAKLGRVTISGGLGSDSLTVDHANGAPLTSAGLSFAGGESPGDDDRIAVTGYAVETVVVNHDGPETGTIQVGTSGLVSFAEVEPVLLDGTTDDLFINLPTMPNPDVAVGADGPSGFSAVSGSTFEYTRFRSPTRKLVVTLGGGGDSVTVRAMDPSFAPAELVIAGGAGSDSLLVAGGGGDDSVAYAPDSAGGGLLTLGGTTRVTLTGVESLTADGLGQSGADAVTVTAPRATVEFGFAAGSGLVTPTAANGSSLLALLYRNFEQAAVAATVVVVRGSEYDDTVGVSADGTVALGYAGGDGHEVRVSADQLTVLGLTGSDHFAVAANHPFAGGVLIDSEAAESAIVNDLTVIGSGGDVILIPDLTGAVTEAGYGTIRYAGMGRTAVDTRGGWLTLVSVVPGAIATAVLSGTNAAEFWLMAGGLVTAAAAGLTVEAPAGTVEQLQVLVDSAAPEDVTVAGGVVQFAGRLTVKAGRGVDALAVAGGPADDTFTVTPGPLPLTVDGGPHAAGDRLVLVGSYPGRLTPGAGSVANVSYQNIELLKLGSVPAAAPDTPSTNEGQPVSIPVLANDTGLGDGPFTVTVESAPAFGTVQVFGTTVVYTPYAGVTPDGGTDSFTYRVEDANGESSVGTVTVTVRPVNAPPVAFTQSVVGPANGSLVLALWADDGDPETAQGLTFTILTAPRHGALTGFDPATGQVTYTPFPGYDGPDSFTFAVTDDATAGGPPLTSPAATVFIQVNRSNRAPVAAADAVTIPQGSTYASPVGGVRNNDSDPDGDTLTVGLVTGPAHGVFSLDRRGTYTYTPDPGFFGTDSFVYTVTDPTGATATATATITVTPTPRKLIATGAGYGGGPHVKVFDAATGEELYSFFAYDASFRGGVRVAVGDVNGDGVPDIVTTPGPGGGPHVKVFSGADLTLLASFFSFDPNFRSGANVAVGDLDADGVAEVVTGAAPGGGSHVRSFRIGPGGAEQIAGPLGSFFAFGADFAGGVNIALGDYDGVAGDEIIVGAATLFPQVRVFGRTGAIIADFLAFDVAHVGITVAAGDVDGDGKADIIVGPGDGGGPVVRTFRGGSGELLTSIAAFDPDLRGGISVAAVGGRTEDGRAAVVAAPTEEARSILILDPSADALLDLLDAYSANFPGGVFVGAG